MSNLKFVIAKNLATVTLREGRKNVFKIEIPKGMTKANIEGALAAIDIDTATQDQVLGALSAAAAKKGSVIPDGYRHQYGVDQNCGDDIAAKLRARTVNASGEADMSAVEQVAGDNGLGDDYDRWVGRGLNNGMIRMNLGNKLRAKARKGEEIRI